MQCSTLKKPQWHFLPFATASGHQLPFQRRTEADDRLDTPSDTSVAHLIPVVPLDLPVRFDSNLDVGETNPLIGLGLAIRISQPVGSSMVKLFEASFTFTSNGRVVVEQETVSPKSSEGSFIAVGWRFNRRSLIQARRVNGRNEAVPQMGRARMAEVLEASLMEAEREVKEKLLEGIAVRSSLSSAQSAIP